MRAEEQSEEVKKRIKKILDRHERLKSHRKTWESHWQDCMRYIVPRKDEITTTRTEGDRRNSDLFDSTAINANQLLAAALHGMLTNPSTRFFDLTFGNDELDDDDQVNRWLQDVADRMFTLMNNTNFQTEIHEVYIDLGAIGTACMFIGEHDEKVVHFSARAIKEIFIEENNLGIIDVVQRVFEWNLRQIVQEFGVDKLPDEMKRLYEKGDDQKYTIIHDVEPDDKDGKDEPGPKYAFYSCYVLKDNSFELSRSGFREFPYAVPRWTKTSGEIYGRGPGMDMLPDIQMVNVMMETTLKGAQKTVDPPLMVEDDGVIGNVRLTPGGLTVVRPGSAPITPLITNARVDFGYQAVEDVRKRIRAGFYVDQLQLNEGPQMTATEVSQRTEEKMRLMGPVLGRQHFEFLRPVIERVFSIMLRRGLLPPAPQKIQGKSFDVRYSSLIARAQRMSEGQNLSRALQAAAPIVNADPKSFQILNSDKAVRYIFDIFGVPKKLMETARDLQDKRDALEKAQAQAQQQAQEQHQADQMQKIAPAVQAVGQLKQNAV